MNYHTTTYTVKAIGEWLLDVLACPFGGPLNGRDAHGEFFSTSTRFHEEQLPLPPVVYYHGFDPAGQPQGEPQFIGRTIKRELREDGVWYRVMLHSNNTLARRVWQAAQRGLARASSGTLAHLKRVDRNGHIRHWLVAEVSLFDSSGSRQPANAYAVALPIMKALYDQAGMALPTIHSGETHMNYPYNDDMNAETADSNQQVTIGLEDLRRLFADTVKMARESAAPAGVNIDDLRQVVAESLERERQARLAAERFLNFYPADPEAAEAQYLIANTWYDQIVDARGPAVEARARGQHQRPSRASRARFSRCWADMGVS
ncbi:MAG: hypothetical protein HC837_13725, partial [Chloroflexaceae bacterium]|nr:hypothetical protein [Chloroflexaceae bacterium]